MRLFPIPVFPFRCIFLLQRILLFQCASFPPPVPSRTPQHSERLPLSPCCPQHVHQAATILLLLIFVSGWGPAARPQPLPASARTGAARPGGWCLIFQGMTHGEMPTSSAKNFKQRLFKKGIEESNHLSRGKRAGFFSFCWRRDRGREVKLCQALGLTHQMRLTKVCLQSRPSSGALRADGTG